MKSAPAPRILIVDDVPDNLRLLAAMLKANGYQARPVTSGKLAIEAALQSPPDLILLDINMPEMDGFAVCARLKREETLKEIPVIFISALSETADKLAAFKAGGVDYVTKPFQEQEVYARVHTHLELRRQREQLRDNLLQLQQLEKLRDDLTHMIAHDMRSPLMAVEGHLKMLELFEAGAFSKEGKSYLTQARQGAGRLGRMIFEMLTVSKLEAGKFKTNPVACDLVQIARKVVAEAEAFKGDKTIRFLPPMQKLTLRVDADLLERVLENLLANAVKFAADAGEVQLCLTATEHQARVEVVDDGVGIRAENQLKIFEKFGQVESGKSRIGTGLGLTFCKLAVEAHGGRIGVNSAPGRGSTFWFTLDR